MQELNQSDFNMKIIKDLGTIFVKEDSKKKRRSAIFECGICNKPIQVVVEKAKRRGSSCCDLCHRSKKTHGQSRTKLYRVYYSMLQRCINPKATGYDRYGGRGISVCEEWQDFKVFNEWSLANGYKEGLTIDRNNNDGNYEPSNCSWETRCIQSRNTSKLRKNNTSGYKGVTFHKSSGKWYSTITVKQKSFHIGGFRTPKEAGQAYDKYVKDNNLEHTLNFT